MKGAFDLVTCPLEGTNLIEASAGTGKTHALAGLFLRLVAERGVDVDKVLVVTFTEAATGELRERIRRLLRDALAFLEGGGTDGLDPVTCALLGGLADRDLVVRRLRVAGITFDEAPIFTIHGFCRSVLAEHAFESGAAIRSELIRDDSGLVRDATDDFWRLHLPQAPRSWLRGALRGGRFSSGPEGLATLLTLRSLDPEARVLPEGPAPDLHVSEGELTRIHAELARIWAASAEEIRRHVVEFAGWNNTRFRLPKREGALRAAASWLEDGDPLDHVLAVGVAELAQATLDTRVKKGFFAPRHAFFELADELAPRAGELSAAAARYGHIVERDYLEWLGTELPRRKRKLGVWGFDDLLMETYRALAGPGGSRLAAALAQRYHAALIDEFQDTDPLQYRIFDRVFRGERCLLYLIGDPKQAIYGFRGADIHAYLRASRAVDGRGTLGVNRRSTPELVKSVNGLFSGHPRPFVHPEIRFLPSTASADAKRPVPVALKATELVIRYHPTGERMARGEAHRVFSQDAAAAVADLRFQGYRPHQVAVLVRTNRQAQSVQDALRERGIPGVLYAAGSVFASEEAAELERIMLSLLRPTSESALRSALATNALGYDTTRLTALGGAELDRLLESGREHHDLWRDRGFMPAFRRYLDRGAVRETLLGLPDGERRLTNFLHLGELAHAAEEEQFLGPEELLAWLRQRRTTPDRNEEEELRLESDAEAVVISTIHRAKGLEYDAVVCPFLWDAYNPAVAGASAYHEEDGRPVLDLEGAEESQRREFDERLAESLRLLYVALTRARHACQVSWGWIKELRMSPLFYILHCRDLSQAELDTGLADALAARDRGLTAERIREDLERLRKAGTIRVSLPSADLPLAPAQPEPVALHPARRSERASWGSWSVTSYSGLTRGRHQDAPARDVDAAEVTETGGGDEGMLGFPRGAGAGSFIHTLMERVVPGATEDPTPQIAELCSQWGYEAKWAPVLTTMVGSVAAVRMGGGGGAGAGFRLVDIPRHERLSELEFHLPVGRLDPGGLADVLAAAGPVWQPLAETVRGLGFPVMRGYLQGFIDLVVRAGTRFYVLDWKSNHLGTRAVDYGPASLARSMHENLYTLQYLLYVVALHRYLAARLDDYDPAAMLGGAVYVYLRGVREDWPGAGLHAACPSPELIGAVDALLTGAGGAS